MKNILLLLLASIIVPAWAEEATEPPPAKLALNAQAAHNIQASPSAQPNPAAAGTDAPTACPTGCALMNCPPPSGPIKCCNTTTLQPC